MDATRTGKSRQGGVAGDSTARSLAPETGAFARLLRAAMLAIGLIIGMLATLPTQAQALPGSITVQRSGMVVLKENGQWAADMSVFRVTGGEFDGQRVYCHEQGAAFNGALEGDASNVTFTQVRPGGHILSYILLNGANTYRDTVAAGGATVSGNDALVATGLAVHMEEGAIDENGIVITKKNEYCATYFGQELLLWKHASQNVKTVAKSLYLDGKAHANDPNTPEDAALIVTDGEGGVQDCAVFAGLGKASLRKSSTNGSFTADNPCYDLAGAQYGVYASEGDALVDLNRKATLTTRSDGSTDAVELVPGTYYVREVLPGRGYAIAETTYPITVHPAQTASIEVADDPQHDPTLAVLAKLDAETGSAHALGAGTLEGAEFTVSWYPGHYDSEGQLPQKPNRTWVLRTDANGMASFDAEHLVSGDDFFITTEGEPTLPLGTMAIRETKAPRGYLPVSDAVSIQKITGSGSKEIIESYVVAEAREQVIRGDVRLVKVDGQTMERLAGVPFLVTAEATGERHVVVTDENGHIDTSSSWNPHTSDTNANDACLGADGSVDEERLNPRAGVWFSGTADEATEPNDALGALPYDTYRFAELRCSSNVGKQLAAFEVIVSRNAVTLNLGTVDDNDEEQPAIGTTLTDSASGKHEVTEGETVTLVDEVSYSGLTPGLDYQLTGTLMLKETGEPLTDGDGNAVTSTVELAPESPTGSIQVKFEVDTTGMAGTTFVAFERLETDGKLVASHENLDDADQSVNVIKRETPPETPEEPEKPKEPQGEPEKPTQALPKTGESRGVALIAGVIGTASLLVGILIMRSRRSI